MANTVVEFDFAHSTGPECACPGCCLVPRGATQSGSREAGNREQQDDHGPDAIAVSRVIDLGLGATFGYGRWADVLPGFAEQQATASDFPYDTVTGDTDQAIDGLLSGYRWDQTSLTYSFPASALDYELNYYNLVAVATVSQLNATQQDVSRSIFDQYAAISGLTFTELGDDAGEQRIDADLRLARSSHPSTAYAYYPNDDPVGGDAMFNTNKYNAPQIGNYQYHTFLHEIGHALGLKHGHETGVAGAVPYEMDSMEYTVMTYRSWVGKPLNYGYANETWGFAQTLMMLDIAAIQRMYGANFNTESGDSVYTFSTLTGEMFINGVGTGTPGGNRVFRTIWDGNGTDTYDFSNYSTDLAINLQPGEYVDLDVGGTFQRAMLDFGYQNNPVTYARGHVFNALQYEGDPRSLIENADGGSGNDSFIGNAADNVFQGNGGNDHFFASSGSDTYFGGTGTDSVEFAALFSSFGFATSGSFLQVIDSAIDWIADTVETIMFADQTWSFGDLFAFASGATTPDAANDSYTVAEDVPLSGQNLLANDSDPESDPLSVTAVNGQAANVGSQVTLASGALLMVNADGTFTYDQNGAFDGLNAGETGFDSFTYSAGDSFGDDEATVSITIEGVTDNRAPDAVNDGYGVAEGAGLGGNVLGNDSDPDSDPLSVTAVNGLAGSVGNQVTLTSGALLTLNADGTFSYDQNGAFDGLNDGQSANDSFSYTVSDGQGHADTATVTITINGITGNQAPDAVNDSYSAAEGAGLGGNVLGNDSDPDGDPLSVTAVNGLAESVGNQVALASGALLTLNADGTFSYDQNGAFVGLNDGQSANDSFSYTVSDGQGHSDTATVTITIAGASPPMMTEAVVIDFEGEPTGAYTGAEGLSFAGLSVQADSALNGVRLGNSGSDGSFTITATGEDFDFDAGLFRAVSGRVRVTIEAWDDGALVGSSSFMTHSNRETTRSFDTSFDSVDQIRVIGDGAILVDDLGFVTYASLDPNGNNPPQAVDDSAAALESGTAAGNVLDNDFDADSDPLTVTSFAGGTAAGGTATLASGATVTMLAAGGFSYDPNGAFDYLVAGASATDSFDYVVSDGNGGTDTGTVQITVSGEGSPPPAVVIGFESGIDQDGFLFSDTVLTTRAKGVVGGGQAGQSTGDSLSFTHAGAFDFESGYFTAFDGHRVEVTVSGYLDGTLIGRESFTISDRRETFHELSDGIFDHVDQVLVTAPGGVIVDDLTLLV